MTLRPRKSAGADSTRPLDGSSGFGSSFTLERLAAISKYLQACSRSLAIIARRPSIILDLCTTVNVSVKMAESMKIKKLTTTFLASFQQHIQVPGSFLAIGEHTLTLVFCCCRCYASNSDAIWVVFMAVSSFP